MKKTADVPLTEQAYCQIKTAILEGRLPPGAPLSRRRLAEEFSMSAVPVGDAILRLESEGLIESRPRAGTRVRIATPDEIHGSYVLREALETHSARLFAELADERSRQRLWKAAEKLDVAFGGLAESRVYSGARHAKVERVHIEFHMLVARASNVRTLINAIEHSRVLLFNWIFTLSREFERFPESWHRDLAEVLVNGSAGDAAEAMRRHVRFRQDEVIERFRTLAEQHSHTAPMSRGPQQRRTAKEESIR